MVSVVQHTDDQCLQGDRQAPGLHQRALGRHPDCRGAAGPAGLRVGLEGQQRGAPRGVEPEGAAVARGRGVALPQRQPVELDGPVESVDARNVPLSPEPCAVTRRASSER